MTKKYLIPAGIALILGLVLAILPSKQKSKELSPEKLLLAMDDPSRFLSTDLITEKIIGKDPALLLIDLRNKKDFGTFSLPGALNISVDSLLTNDVRSLLSQKGKDIVFYSNDDILADQAWMICKRMPLKNIYVMKGGMNEWFNTIMMEATPGETASGEEHELYEFRKAARQYLTGGEEEIPADAPLPLKKEKKEIIKQKAKPAPASGGGC